MPIIEATCTGGGIIQDKCERCGKYGDFKSVEALGHNWQTNVVEPTHTEVGYTDYTCETCGESYRSDYTAPVGHTFGEGTVTKAATCTAEGERTYSCSCGNTHTVSVPKTDHNIKSKITAPTCTDFGYTTRSCKNCKYSYIEAYTAPADHTYDTNSATCTEKAHCTVCGVECGELNEHNHTSEAEWTTTDKKHTKTFSCCDLTEVEKEEHEWKDGICTLCGYSCKHIGGTATCSEQAICTICSAHYSELDPNNHVDLDHIAEHAATTDAEGNIEHWHCEECGKYYSDRGAKTEISLKDSVTAKLPKDYTDLIMWLIPILLNTTTIVILVITLTKRKKNATAKV